MINIDNKIIFTVLKNGEALMPQVLKGVCTQTLPACLVPITSRGIEVYSEENRRQNVLECLRVNENNYLVLMDSDVVLGEPKILEEMFKDTINLKRDIISVTSKNEIERKLRYVPHALILIKGKSLDYFKIWMQEYKITDNSKHGCIICRFLLQNEKDVLQLECKKVIEIPRITMRGVKE